MLIDNHQDAEKKRQVDTKQANGEAHRTEETHITSPRGGQVKKKRLTLSLDWDIFNTLQNIADSKRTSLTDVVRTCILLGMMVYKLESDPDKTFIIRDENGERPVAFMRPKVAEVTVDQ